MSSLLFLTTAKSGRYMSESVTVSKTIRKRLTRLARWYVEYEIYIHLVRLVVTMIVVVF